MPERFDLTYIDEAGEKKRPVVIHRAILGTFDRFMAYLIEETKGAFPLWLAPIQVMIIPVNQEYHLKYAKEVESLLKEAGIRVRVDAREEKLGYRLRESQTKKIPYSLILGDQEEENQTVNYRKYGEQQTTTLKVSECLDLLKEEIKNKDGVER